MIDLDSETLISFQEATRHAPGKPHISTLHRWRRRGVHGVRLETCLIGGKRYTTREAMNRFFESVTAVSESDHTNKQALPANRQKEIERAEAVLINRIGK